MHGFGECHVRRVIDGEVVGSSQHRASSGRCGARRAGSAARSSSAWPARRPSSPPPVICRRSTDATSRSASSGIASRSPRSRARALSPSVPSSARATTRTLASTTSTVGPDHSHRRLQRDRAAGSPACPVEISPASAGLPLRSAGRADTLAVTGEQRPRAGATLRACVLAHP